jgi:organic hydroperoxide reductase OsmC/OhrA
MHPLPHLYQVGAQAKSAGNLSLAAAGLPALATDSPREFDGPGDQWSPESLLCAAVASCFILTFRAIARASKFNWHDLKCKVEGTLERKDGTMKFTRFSTHAILEVDPAADKALAQRLLEKAEHGCLVTNSLTAERVLTTEIRQGQ